MELYFRHPKLEAGCDEAGRGCLAGPVFAAAVIWNSEITHPLLNDSKQLSEKQRYELRPFIEQHAISWAVAKVEPEEIDRINILNASILAMHKALDLLSVRPEFVIIDGNRFRKYKNIEHRTIVKGDSKYYSIAAASILAKTYRDDYMNELDLAYPNYGWSKNKGYPTASHRKAIEKYGISIHHRRSFRLLNPQLELF